MKTAATIAQLHDLLDAGQAWSATYRGGLSNHLPMAQQALLELGASAARLQAWTEAYAIKLEPQHPSGPDAAGRAHFRARIAALGAGGALHEALARLLDEPGAMAFHGLIRVAHAVLAGHEAELAAGLAHWASRFEPLPATPAGPPLSLADWLRALAALPAPAYPSGASISGRMRAWAGAPGFAAIAGRLRQGPDSLRELALLAARTYAATGNFTVLHLLTASHAMTVLQPWWPAPELARGFGIAAAAGLLASGTVPALTLDRAPGRRWPELIGASCAQDDEHVIKLTHAAWRLDRRWPDPAWRRAVERAIPD